MTARLTAALLLLLPVLGHAENVAITGKGHRFIGADRSLAIVEADGSVAWKQPVGGTPHDLSVLPNGNILVILDGHRVVELDATSRKEVWSYDSSKMNGNDGKKIEVHATQRLADGLTMIAESGVSRIIEVDKDGTIKHQIALKVSNPQPHRDMRLVRKLTNGNYLVCHEGDGVVKEYDGKGDVVWEFPVPLFDKKPAGGHGPEAWGNQSYGAVRLTNGNTLITTGNGHGIIEVTPAKEITWQLKQGDLPGITFAWITTVQALPDGTIVFGNCHAGPENPQLIAINREKQVLWSYKNFDLFGNSLAMTQVLDVPGLIR
ncbi:MAG TPA: PQQ-binding-like beta-propeller repeat protein [Planctomycetota bacterium]|nr:PQQ-binding-like beta-propeller repeat protein [Planctomycetota bacterium]